MEGGAGLVRGVKVTTGDVHDAAELAAVWSPGTSTQTAPSPADRPSG